MLFHGTIYLDRIQGQIDRIYGWICNKGRQIHIFICTGLGLVSKDIKKNENNHY